MILDCPKMTQMKIHVYNICAVACVINRDTQIKMHDNNSKPLPAWALYDVKNVRCYIFIPLYVNITYPLIATA